MAALTRQLLQEASVIGQGFTPRRRYGSRMRAPLSPELRLGIAPGCFRPSEDLLYPFAHTLGNLIALGGSDRQAAPSGLRLQGNMRPDPGLPGIALEGPGFVAFVGTKCGAALYLALPDHLGGRLALGSASCLGQLCRDSQALPVLAPYSRAELACPGPCDRAGHLDRSTRHASGWTASRLGSRAV